MELEYIYVGGKYKEEILQQKRTILMRCLHLGVSIKCLYWDYLCYLLTNYNNRCDDGDESVDK